MITVKLKDLQRSLPAIKALSTLGVSSMSIHTRYWIGKLISPIESELKYLEDSRKQLVKEFGVCTNPETDEWAVEEFIDEKTNEKFTQFMLHWNDLLEHTVDLNGRKIRLEELKDTTLSAQDLYLLDWLIEPPVDMEGGEGVIH